MIILILFAFLGGLVTVLSPCILPVLPIVLSGSLTGGKKRPFGIITGFVLSFTFFTLLLSTIVKSTGISADSLRNISVFVILAFGVTLLFPQTQAFLEKLLSKLSSKQNTANKNGFSGGILIGLSLGLVWAPCVGPILASVITLAATSQVGFATLFITLAYSVGTAIPMLAITYGGRNLLNKNPWILQNTEKIQKLFGVFMILTAIAIHQNYDRKFQAFILEKFPNYGVGLTSIEDNQIVQQELDKLKNQEASSPKKIFQKKAPGFEGGNNWINSNPLVLEELRGSVVLVDFWTYSCINCIRTLPYLTSWHEKYKDEGLIIVGVHSPEFEFEKDTQNVIEALKDFNIEYPVVQDNDFNIWKSYNNRYWPAKYLIDKNGTVRYTHFGEGKYNETENMIQELLEESGSDINQELTRLDEFVHQTKTPETYLGYWRLTNTNVEESIKKDSEQSYTPKPLKLNQIAFEGKWNIQYKHASPSKESKLHLKFFSKDVHLVMRSDEETKVKIYIDEQTINKNISGTDVMEGIVTIQKDRLYNLVKDMDPAKHTLTIEFLDEGIEVYAFTFG
ncbi:cytochrome c biogenesis protein DipZ [Patescibacteria group bacterium]